MASRTIDIRIADLDEVKGFVADAEAAEAQVKRLREQIKDAHAVLDLVGAPRGESLPARLRAAIDGSDHNAKAKA